MVSNLVLLVAVSKDLAKHQFAKSFRFSKFKTNELLIYQICKILQIRIFETASISNGKNSN